MSTATATATFTARPAFTSMAPRSVPPVRGGVRLTRRGRVVLVVLALIGAAALLLGTAGGSVADGPAPATATVVVQPGDTLWSVATAALPGIDPREAVDEVRALNGLESAVVVPGQALKVPASA